MTMVASLSKAFALSVPRLETEAIRDDLVYFQCVRAAIRDVQRQGISVQRCLAS